MKVIPRVFTLMDPLTPGLKCQGNLPRGQKQWALFWGKETEEKKQVKYEEIVFFYHEGPGHGIQVIGFSGPLDSLESFFLLSWVLRAQTELR